MARYYFDLYDGQHHRDDEGSLCADILEVRGEVNMALPRIAAEAIHRSDGPQCYSMAVRDGEGRIIYTASLTFAGVTWPLPEGSLSAKS